MRHTARLTRVLCLLLSALVILCMPVPGSNRLDLPSRHWLTGSLTAVHTLTKETGDMRETTDMEGMLGLLELYCLKHRQHSFSHAVESLVTDLYPTRMTHMPQQHERLP